MQVQLLVAKICKTKRKMNNTTGLYEPRRTRKTYYTRDAQGNVMISLLKEMIK